LKITNWGGALALSPQKNKGKHIHFQLQNTVTPNLVGKQA
jgi:hypothetical protein